MVRRTTQTHPNAIAMGHKALKKSKDKFMDTVSSGAGLTYAQFTDKSRKNPVGNYLSIEMSESDIAIKAMENIIEELTGVLEIMKRTV